MDAHSEYARDYVAECLTYSRTTGAENVGGPMRAVGHGYVGEAWLLPITVRSVLEVGDSTDERTEGEVDTVYLGAFLAARVRSRRSL